MKVIVFVLVGFLMIIVSCRNESAKVNPQTPVIGFNYETVKLAPYDSLFKNIRYVMLETNSYTLIEKYDDIRIIDNIIFVVSKSGIQKALFAFTMNGSHLFTIDSPGRGPGEYYDIRDFYLNRKDSLIGILSASREIIYFNFDGKYSGKTISLKDYDLSQMLYWKDAYYTFDRNFSGGTGNILLLSVFNSKWKHIQRGYPVRFEIASNTLGNKGYFASNSTEAFFYYDWSDTIYRISKGVLKPGFALDFGFTWPTEQQKIEISEMVSGKDHRDWLKYILQNKLAVNNVQKLNVTDRYIMLYLSLPKVGMTYMLSSIDGKDLILFGGSQKRRNLYPVRIWCYENKFYGILEPWLINNNKKSDEFTGSQPTSESEFSPYYFEGYKEIQSNDNGVLVFFEINEDFVSRNSQSGSSPTTVNEVLK